MVSPYISFGPLCHQPSRWPIPSSGQLFGFASPSSMQLNFCRSYLCKGANSNLLWISYRTCCAISVSLPREMMFLDWNQVQTSFCGSLIGMAACSGSCNHQARASWYQETNPDHGHSLGYWNSLAHLIWSPRILSLTMAWWSTMKSCSGLWRKRPSEWSNACCRGKWPSTPGYFAMLTMTSSGPCWGWPFKSKVEQEVSHTHDDSGQYDQMNLKERILTMWSRGLPLGRKVPTSTSLSCRSMWDSRVWKDAVCCLGSSIRPYHALPLLGRDQTV